MKNIPQMIPSRRVFLFGVVALGLLIWSIFYALSPNEKVIVQEPDVITASIGSVPLLIGSTQIDQIEETDSVFRALNNLGNQIENQPNPVDSLTLSPSFYPDHYSQRDLSIVSTNDATTALYLFALRIVFDDRLEDLRSEPLDLVNTWLETNDPAALDEIERLSGVYVEATELLMRVVVPDVYAEAHLELANNLYKEARSLLDIDVTPHDPTAGFFAAANYANYQSKRAKAFAELFRLASGKDPT